MGIECFNRGIPKRTTWSWMVLKHPMSPSGESRWGSATRPAGWDEGRMGGRWQAPRARAGRPSFIQRFDKNPKIAALKPPGSRIGPS
jgi:hypothetical protein